MRIMVLCITLSVDYIRLYKTLRDFVLVSEDVCGLWSCVSHCLWIIFLCMKLQGVLFWCQRLSADNGLVYHTVCGLYSLCMQL